MKRLKKVFIAFFTCLLIFITMFSSRKTSVEASSTPTNSETTTIAKFGTCNIGFMDIRRGYNFVSELNPNGNDRFVFRIIGNTTMTRSLRELKIKIRTKDGTSIGQAGDYTPIDIEVDLEIRDGFGYSKSNIIINTKPSDYIFDDNKSYFNLEIYEISDPYRTETYDDVSIKCIQASNYNLTSTNNSTYGRILDAYNAKSDYDVIGSSKKRLLGGNTIDFEWNLDNSFANSNYYLAVSKGLANYYVGASGKLSGYDWRMKSYYDFWSVSLKDKDGIVRESKYSWYSDISWTDFIMSEKEKNPKYYSKFTWDENFKMGEYHVYGQTRSGTATPGNMFQINGSTAYLSFYNPDSNPAYEVKEWSMTAMIDDIKAPEILGYYILDDVKALTKNDKLRIGIRFSEPVQFYNKNQASNSLYAYLNNSSDSIGLKYVTGEGTNTLIFESDTINDLFSHTINTTSISRLEINENIRDYSNPLNKDDNSLNLLPNDKKVINCNLELKIDNRVPSVNVECKNALSPSMNKSLSIQISNVSIENLKFEYKFIAEDELKDLDFDNISDLTTIENKTNILLTDGNKNGDYYFYWRVTTNYGIVRDNRSDINLNVLKYDNSPPEISNLEVVKDSDNNTDFTFKFKMIDNPYGINNPLNQISKVKFIYSDSYKFNTVESKTVYDLNDSSISSKYYFTNIENDIFSFKITASMLGIKENDFRDLYVGVIALDNAGNETNYFDPGFESKFVKFDTRDNLEGVFKVTGEYDESIKVYKTGSIATFEIDSSYDASRLQATIIAYEKSVNGAVSEKTIENPSEYFDQELDGNIFKITFKKSGYYEIIYNLDNIQYSNTYSLYVSEKGQDGTDNNYNSDNVINKAYTIENANFYYYSNDNRIITEKYNNTNLSQMFSSFSSLQEYIRYYEYRDLYAEIITEEVALNLRSGTSSINRMAKGETTVPVAGQIWIRYKKADWNNSNLNTDWVYYFYSNNTGDDLRINVNNLSMNLNSSINAVVETITSNYKTVYLVTEEYIRNGVPYLDPSRIHPEDETILKTNLGITIENAIFAGDKGIYDTYYTFEGEQYLLASNYKLVYNKYTHIYIKGDGAYFEEFNNSYEDKELKSFLKTGRYTLIEVDENGYSSRLIYIVNEAPSIDVRYITKDSSELTPRILDKESNNQVFNTKNFQITNMQNSIDDFAYILVYLNNNPSNYQVYYKSDFDNGTIIDLTNGKYTIEVGDRFNNTYRFTVQINNDDIDFRVNVVPNEYIRTSCSLNKEDIFTFEVYLNEKPLKVSYDNNLTFKQSGSYRFYIEDIYGNTFDNIYELVRDNPNVSWFYDDDGSFVNIETNPRGAYLEKISENAYKIYTNGRLQFTYSESNSYDFSISDGCKYETASYYGTRRITLNSFDFVTVKVYYSEFMDSYCEYSIFFDDNAPIIDGYVLANDYEYDDKKDQASDYSSIKPTKLDSSSKFAISNNQEIYANSLRFEFNDDIGISYLKVLIDNELFIEETSQFKDVYEFSKYGKYEIFCEDRLGNTSTFIFYNKEPEYYTYYLDDFKQEISFDPIASYQNYSYGHDNILYKFNNIDELTFIIDNEYYCFVINDGILYRVIINSSLDKENVILIDSNNKRNVDYVDVDDKTGIWLRAKYEDNNFCLLLSVIDNNLHQIDSRCLSNLSYIPFYFSAELYGKKSEINFIKENKELIHLDNYLGFYNDIFALINEDESIISIKYAYNTIQSFNDYIELLTLEDFPLFGGKDGYYSFIVLNKYGNETKYLIVISKELLVDCNIKYEDGYSLNYTVSSENIYYTNKLATIRVYSQSSTCVIKKDDLDFTFNKIEYQNYYEIVLQEMGIYKIKIVDENENIKEFTIEISNDKFDISDDILFGFNDNALRKDELYTNQKISINKNLINSLGITLINMSFGDKYYVLFDNISLDKIDDDSYLNEFIGSLGSGIYKLYFRNRYGSYSYKEVHYQEEDLFKISRMTRSELRYQNYLLDDAINDGVYSNNAIMLESSATKYILKIDDILVEAPYTFKFPSNALQGTYRYKISYIDEYGFSYNFDVNLIRQDIDYELKTLNSKDIDGIITVNGDFSLLFDETYKASYLINGVNYKYLSNQVISNDGSYLFTIEDKAGNTKKATIKKDSIVSFIIRDTLNDKVLVDGDISNSNQVLLQSQDGDSITIVKAYLNGVNIENPSSSFTDNGKWEILVSDAIGNLKYTSFYIYTHAISSFEYKTPYNYKITELMYRDENGNRLSYMDNVNQSDYYSSVLFEINGTYNVIMNSLSTGDASSFEIKISNSKPEIKLIGVENDGETKNKVTLSGYSEGDTILIYKDNTLIQTIKVTSSEMKSPEIKDMGDYVIEVVNVEGNKTILKFRRVYTANTASSVFIIITLFGVSTILFIGLFFRKKEKIE